MTGRRALGPGVKNLKWRGGTTLRETPLIPTTEREQTDLETVFEFQMTTSRIVNAHGWQVEHQFNPIRKWRFDFSFVRLKVAVEIEGGTWATSRHTTPQGFEADCEKYNAAAIAGWTVLRFTGDMVEDGRGLIALEQLLRVKGRNATTQAP